MNPLLLVILDNYSMKKFGGVGTLVEHLSFGLRHLQVPHLIVRCPENENCVRQSGTMTYGSEYVTMRRSELVNQKILICASHRDMVKQEEVDEIAARNDAYTIFHDVYHARLSLDRTIAVGQRHVDSGKAGVYIPHPYWRYLKEANPLEGRKRMLHHCRISNEKRSDWCVEANLRLRAEGREEIAMFGREKRHWSFFKLKKIDPSWVVGSHEFPSGYGSCVNLASEYIYNVDLTTFPEDGGRSQYTQLEAMDAGAVPVMHKDWGATEFATVQIEHPHQLYCLMTWNPDLAALSDVVRYNRDYLVRVHDAAKVAKQYVDVMF